MQGTILQWQVDAGRFHCSVVRNFRDMVSGEEYVGVKQKFTAHDQPNACIFPTTIFPQKALN